MTTQDLAPGAMRDDDSGALSSGALGALFEASPARLAQTSAAAETAFVLGLLAVLAVPFSLTMTLSLGLAAVALVSSILGMARASRSGIAGGVLASLGMVLALGTAALIGLRYLGVDTAVGDDLVPHLRDWLDTLNTLLPKP